MKKLLILCFSLLSLSLQAQAQPIYKRTSRQTDITNTDSLAVPLKGMREYLNPQGRIRYINSAGVRMSAAEALGLTALTGGAGSGTAVAPTTFGQITGNLPLTRVTGWAQIAATGAWGDINNRPLEYPSSVSLVTGSWPAGRLSNLSSINNSVFNNDANYQNATQVNTAINNGVAGLVTTSFYGTARSVDQAATTAAQNTANGAVTTANNATAVNATQATAITNLQTNKVDVIAGKGLSTVDFTAALLSKLNGLTQADGSETKITQGTNVTVTGAGTTASPYVVSSSGGTGGGSPTGAAGGDFTGTYPNPTLKATGPGAGTYGGGTSFIQSLEVDLQGRVKSIIAGIPTGGSSGTSTSGNPKVVVVMTPTIAGIQAAINSITQPGWTVLIGVNSIAVGDGERIDINNKIRFTFDMNGCLFTGTRFRTLIYCNGTSQDLRLTGGRIDNTTDTTLPYNGTYGYYGMITTQEDAKINGFEIDHMEMSNPNMPSDMIFFVNYRDVQGNNGGTALIQHVRIHDNWAHDGGRMFYESINAGFTYGDLTVRNRNIAVFNNVCYNLGLVLDSNGNRYGMSVSQDGASDRVEVYGNFFIDGVGNDVEMVNVTNYSINANVMVNLNQAKVGSNGIGCSDNRRYLSKGGVVTGNRTNVFGRSIYMIEQEDVVVTGNNFRSLNGADFIVKQGTFSGNKFQATRPQAAVVNFHSAIYDNGTVAWVSSDNDFLGNSVSNLGANVANGYGGPTSLVYVYDGAMNNVFDGNVFRQGMKGDGTYHGNHLSFGNGSTTTNNTVGTNFTFQGAVVGYGTTITGASNATATAGQSVTTTVDSNTATVLLVDGNGLPDLSTAINDRSSYKHTISPKATIHVTTIEKKYGTGSIYFNGTSEFLTITASTSAAAALTFGTADFTMEYWLKPQTLPSGTIGGLLSKSTTADNKIAWTTGWTGSPTAFAFNISNSSGSDTNPGPAATGVNFQNLVWQHVAIVSAGGVRKLYLNGVPLATSTAGTSLEFSGLDGPLVLGARNTGGCCLFNGWLHTRVKKGNYYNVTGAQSFTPDASF